MKMSNHSIGARMATALGLVLALLLGAALAMVWRPGRLSTHLTAGAKAVVTAVGVTALLVVLYFFWQVGEYSNFLYRGGFLVLSGVVCVLIAAASHPGAPFGKMIGSQPWRYIGQRSYGLYLYHWPIYVITRPDLDIPLDGPVLLALRLGLTFLIVADFSGTMALIISYCYLWSLNVNNGWAPNQQTFGNNDLLKANDGNYAWEWWYKFQVTDNISVTPALYYLSAPEGQLQKSNNDSFTNFGGLVKTTFKF